MQLGTNSVDSFKLGSTAVDRVYLGSTLAWEPTTSWGSDYAEQTAAWTNDANTILLLNMDGSSGSTTFTDSSSNNWPITQNGYAQVKTDFVKFGTGSLQPSIISPAQGGYIYIHESVSMDALRKWWINDYTCECWHYAETLDNLGRLSSGQYLVQTFGNMYLGGRIRWAFGPNTNGNLCFNYWDDVGNVMLQVISDEAIEPNKWNHIGFQYNSSADTISLLLNGSIVKTEARSGTQVTTGQMTVGVYDRVTNVRIDELRVSNTLRY
jgi:hypothetical protein